MTESLPYTPEDEVNFYTRLREVTEGVASKSRLVAAFTIGAAIGVTLPEPLNPNTISAGIAFASVGGLSLGVSRIANTLAVEYDEHISGQ